MSAKKKEHPEDELPGNERQENAEEAAVSPDALDGAELAPDTEDVITPEAELAAEKEKYLRLAAEYDNFRKRSAKEREAIFSDVRADTLIRFLPVYDNLARAIVQETPDEAYRKGVEMIMAQFMEVLGKLGVMEIPALGERFDPGLHEAVMHGEDETLGEGMITEEFQKGFKLGDRVIRFSMVKVVN